jgi:pSer/pThr/pTyr-binding forkhead associated (FHA) protein
MAKLQFSLEGNSLGEFELSKERMTIGRRPVNDIHIDNLAVSGEHAAITTIGNDSFLEDMNSTNGTLVNSKPIKKHVLHHNDVIEFGKYQLLYINAAQAKLPANHAGFENTVVMRPAKLLATVEEAPKEENVKTAEPAVESEKPLVANVAFKKLEPIEKAKPVEKDEPIGTKAAPTENISQNTSIARLQMLNGSNAGRELLLNKALTTLGKPGAQVAVVTKRSNGYYITHVEGENVPSINGQKIGLQAHALNHNDVIEIAGAKMEFFLA